MLYTLYTVLLEKKESTNRFLYESIKNDDLRLKGELIALLILFLDFDPLLFLIEHIQG